MPEGVISGGWEFVVAVYVITAAGFAGYGFSLWRRLRAADDDEERPQTEESP